MSLYSQYKKQILSVTKKNKKTLHKHFNEHKILKQINLKVKSFF